MTYLAPAGAKAAMLTTPDLGMEIGVESVMKLGSPRHTPDWQDHLMHVMTYVWSFPPPHIFSPMVIEVVKAEYPAGQL